ALNLDHTWQISEAGVQASSSIDGVGVGRDVVEGVRAGLKTDRWLPIQLPARDEEHLPALLLDERKPVHGRPSMSTATPITDHNQIRRWADENHGRPSRVKGTGQGSDPGMLRLDFDEKDENL